MTPDWPTPPAGGTVDAELWKARVAYAQSVAIAEVNARIAADKATLDAEIADRKREADERSQVVLKREDADIASRAAFHAAMVDVAKGTIERARAGAEFVQKGAAAIVGLYTALLGVVFSVADNPMPSRGLVPPVLLSASVVLSTVYLAYLSKAGDVAAPTPNTDRRKAAMNRTIAFILWTRAGAMNRKHFLHASVIALAFALIALPAPFVDVTPDPAPATVAKEAAAGWPQPDTGMNVELAKILYKAQVTEAAAARAAGTPAVADDDDSIWWLGCAIALVVSLVAPRFINRESDSGGDEDGELPGPAAE